MLTLQVTRSLIVTFENRAFEFRTAPIIRPLITVSDHFGLNEPLTSPIGQFPGVSRFFIRLTKPRRRFLSRRYCL